MKESQNTTQPQEKPGLLKRIFGKVDAAMKAKAEEKSQSGCCGGSPKSGKGDKCC